MLPFLVIIVSPALVVGWSAATCTDCWGMRHKENFFYGIAEKRTEGRVGQVAIESGARDMGVILAKRDTDDLACILPIRYSDINIAFAQTLRKLRPTM